MPHGGVFTDINATFAKDLVEQWYAKCRPGHGEFHKYILDAQGQ